MALLLAATAAVGAFGFAPSQAATISISGHGTGNSTDLGCTDWQLSFTGISNDGVNWVIEFQGISLNCSSLVGARVSWGKVQGTFGGAGVKCINANPNNMGSFCLGSYLTNQPVTQTNNVPTNMCFLAILDCVNGSMTVFRVGT